MFCQKCGTKLDDDTRFCQDCGTKVVNDDTEKQSLDVVTPPVAETDHKPKQAIANNSTIPAKVGGELHNIVKFCNIILGITVLLGTVNGFFGLGINTKIFIIGIAIGFIGFVLDKLMGKSKILAFGIIGIAVIVIAVVLSGSNGSSDGSDKYIQMVKGGTLEEYPQKTVGKAFDEFMKNSNWESGMSEDGQRFVNVKGNIMYADKEVTAVIQFFVNINSGTFEYNACEFNGIPQNNVIFWALLEKVYE